MRQLRNALFLFFHGLDKRLSAIKRQYIIQDAEVTGPELVTAVVAVTKVVMDDWGGRPDQQCSPSPFVTWSTQGANKQ